MSNMYSGDFAFGKLYVFMHCLSVCIILRVHSLSKCLPTVINVYNISFLVATPCLRFYSLSKCLFIVLVPITCLIVFTMSVWTSVSICLSVYTQCLQYLHCVPLSLFVIVSIHCLNVYIAYTTTSVSLYSEGLFWEIFMIWFPVYLSNPRDPVISASLCT